jgi:hypothetical protein
VWQTVKCFLELTSSIMTSFRKIPNGLAIPIVAREAVAGKTWHSVWDRTLTVSLSQIRTSTLSDHLKDW